MKFKFCILVITLFAACTAKDNREGTHIANGEYVTFSDSTSGWTTRYPKNWPLLTPAEIAALEGRGEEALAEAAGGELIFNHRNLLWLKKDHFNSITSNYQLFDQTIDGPYEDTEKIITDVLEATYEQQGLLFDSRNGTTVIDGLTFTTWEANLFTPDHADTLMTQVMYMRLINNRVALLLNINYNNPVDRNALLTIIHSSKFGFRN